MALVLALCVGGYALAKAQPRAAQNSAAAPSSPLAAEPTDSPLLSEPKTPVEMFNAAELTARLYRPGLAKRYLEKLLQSNPSDEVLFDLRTQYGPAVFLRLARDKALQPEAGQLLARVTAVFKKHAEDPAFVDTLIRGLYGSPAERDDALETLRSSGPKVVPRILQHFQNPDKSDASEVLVQTLAQLGAPIVPVLLGALDSGNDAVRGAAIQTLGLMQTKDAVPYLLGLAFDKNQPDGTREAAKRSLAEILHVPTEKGDGVSSFGTEAKLQKVVRNCLANKMTWPTIDGKTQLWTWDEQTQSMVEHQVSPATASLYTGLKFARQALALAPENREAQVLFLALNAAWDAQGSKEHGGPNAVRKGPGSPHDLILEAGPNAVSDMLALGLQMGSPSISIAALNAMSSVGGRAQLYGPRSPLIAALNFPNPEVQYAAAVTVLQLNPRDHFRGSGRVVEILTRALTGTPSPFAVVIDPNPRRANETAGLLSQIGFQAIAASTGREGFELAVSRSNVVLVAVQVNVNHWPLSQTVSNLRADARSAQIPILIYGPESVRPELEGILTRVPETAFLIESLTQANVEVQVSDFLKRALAMTAPPQDHASRVAGAAYWLAQIANGNRTDVFDLHSAESALLAISTDRRLYGEVFAALSAIPTATVQRNFEQLAVSERLDAPIREAAARRLAAHIRDYGLLLTASEVSELEAAWHTAQTQNPEVASALVSAVGALKPNAKRIGNRLQRTPPPPNPVP